MELIDRPQLTFVSTCQMVAGLPAKLDNSGDEVKWSANNVGLIANKIGLFRQIEMLGTKPHYY